MFLNNSKKETNIDVNFYKNKKNFNFKFLILAVIILIIFISLVIFVKNNEKKEYYLVLNGDTDLVIKQNDFYLEEGFKAYDNHGNDLSKEVIINGEVNSSVAGEYKITYTFNNIVRERTILVVADDSQVTYLILNGSTTIFLKVGEEYQEPGYMVIDNLEDNLEDKVTVSGNVNPQVVGTYKLKYSVTNKSGITVTEERTIIVMDSDINISYSPTKVTNGKVTISISVNDNYFDYLVLPDNTQVKTRTTTYQVTQNGVYKFKIYSKDGSSKERDVVVENIDKEGPTGSCQATRKNGLYLINVNAIDNAKIKEYQYYLDNRLVKTNTLNYLNYQSELTDNIYVVVTDHAGNTKKIDCNINKVYDLEVHFINVGREDAILIRSNEATIFIDGGLYHQKDVILPYLQSLGIKKFDAIIGSHLHNNHIQAEGAIIDNYPVDKVYYPQDLYTCNPTYCSSSGQKYVLDAIKRHNIPQVIMKVGDHITIGDLTIDCYSPIKIQTKSQNKYAENNNSLNFVLTYGKNKFMFTGDHMQSSDILKQYDSSLMDIDVFKYPHHGQDNVGRDMVYAMSPEYVIVTNTQIDSLKSRKEYSYFNDLGSKIYYSGKHKHILIKSDGNNLTVIPNANPSDYKR